MFCFIMLQVLFYVQTYGTYTYSLKSSLLFRILLYYNEVLKSGINFNQIVTVLL